MNEESDSRIISSANSITFETADLSENLFRFPSAKRENLTNVKKTKSVADDVNYEEKSSFNKKSHTKNSSSSSSRAKEKKEKAIKKNLLKD